MQCNIDDEGARMRRTSGIMLVLTGAMLTGLALWSGIWWLWVIAPTLLAAGGFCIFEAQKKWCALRAMGVKTPH